MCCRLVREIFRVIKKSWDIDKACSGETSLIGEVSISVWVNALRISFLFFQQQCHLIIGDFQWSEWSWFIMRNNSELIGQSESASSLIWGEKRLKRCALKRWKLSALKKFLSQTSGCSPKTCGGFFRSNPNPAIWNYLWSFGDFVCWFSQPGEDVKITVRWLWREGF